jgi:hypothetical protein
MSLMKISSKSKGLMTLGQKIKNSGFTNLGSNTGAKRSYVLSMLNKQKGVGKVQGEALKKFRSTTHAGDESKKALSFLNNGAKKKINPIHSKINGNTKAGKLVVGAR